MLGDIAGRFGGKLSEGRQAAVDAVIVLNRGVSGARVVHERRWCIEKRVGLRDTAVNFGAEPAWMEPLSGYTFTGKVPLEDRVLGTQAPEKREDAEVSPFLFFPCGA
ncbi:hypothetical protein E2C01_081526 [Portunus trituberculatus]|uniref:Uncharacterized protein n=1 Tax=Portunus trituberculatus TaxID=210409 RepID=A0A5B7IQ03_PORTR|nr:hypothetical protein [Portunus trituberculatus]